MLITNGKANAACSDQCFYISEYLHGKENVHKNPPPLFFGSALTASNRASRMMWTQNPQEYLVRLKRNALPKYQGFGFFENNQLFQNGRIPSPSFNMANRRGEMFGSLEIPLEFRPEKNSSFHHLIKRYPVDLS